MKTVAIMQSNYIPWVGYFDIINRSDVFVLYDDMQYTRRDWRNRNKVKTPSGLKWLTIPAHAKGRYHQKIKDTEISDNQWSSRHWDMLRQNYRKAPHFSEVAPVVQELYSRCAEWVSLSKVNHLFLSELCDYLDVDTTLKWSMNYELPEVDDPTERLIQLCQAAGGTHYLSGPSARDYMDLDAFHKRGLAVDFIRYDDYPEYPQTHGEFERYVSLLDLLFHVGFNAAKIYLHSLSDS